jgi:hypothetical protein
MRLGLQETHQSESLFSKAFCKRPSEITFRENTLQLTADCCSLFSQSCVDMSSQVTGLPKIGKLALEIMTELETKCYCMSLRITRAFAFKWTKMP